MIDINKLLLELELLRKQEEEQGIFRDVIEYATVIDLINSKQEIFNYE